MLCSSHRKEQQEGQGGDHSHTQALELTSREGGGELETQSRERDDGGAYTDHCIMEQQT